MSTVLIKEAKLVNEGKIFSVDVLIKGERIEKIGSGLQVRELTEEINAQGSYLIPGMIDAHVHFREPGLTYKGSIASESAAAVAGGVTSFFDMPNTNPYATTRELLEQKYALAASTAAANYSFFFGLNQHNLEEALRINYNETCGMTDDGLAFEDGLGGLCNRLNYLEQVLTRTSAIVALHCEDEAILLKNLNRFAKRYPGGIPYACHSEIRSEEACVLATSSVIELAERTSGHLHVLHVSTAREAELIGRAAQKSEGRISGEVCVHHLYFSKKDYAEKGSQLVWNPSIKSERNRNLLKQQLELGHLNFIATDHAPHALHEKQGNYLKMKPGAPAVQHALRAVLHLYGNKEEYLPFVVENTSHNVARRYKISERGFLREGYYADLVLLSLKESTGEEQRLYACGWSPFYGLSYGNSIEKTFVNGHLAFNNGKLMQGKHGKRILFNKTN